MSSSLFALGADWLISVASSRPSRAAWAANTVLETTVLSMSSSSGMMNSNSHLYRRMRSPCFRRRRVSTMRSLTKVPLMLP